MTGKGREVADLMERREVDILSVQETRWKGEKARCIGGKYKMYCGSGNKKNVVEITLKKEHVERVVELWRVTDRIICLKMELDGVMLNVISVYAPQVGCIQEEKEAFWLDLDETVKKIPKNERMVVGADLNEHIGEGNNCDEEFMGRHGLGKRNNEGQAVVDFAKRMELAITNTYLVKRPAHRVIYNSGGHSLQVNYVMVRRRRIKEVVDTKVIVGEKCSKTAPNSSQCNNHLDKVEESTKTSEENKMVEVKGFKSKKQIQNRNDQKWNTWWTGRLAKSI